MHYRLRSQHDQELISKIINWTYSGSRLVSGFKGKPGLIKRSAYERASEWTNQSDGQRASGKRTTSCVPLVKIRYWQKFHPRNGGREKGDRWTLQLPVEPMCAKSARPAENEKKEQTDNECWRTRVSRTLDGMLFARESTWADFRI